MKQMGKWQNFSFLLPWTIKSVFKAKGCSQSLGPAHVICEKVSEEMEQRIGRWELEFLLLAPFWSYLWDINHLFGGLGRKKISCELRYFKNKNGCSNLQMINKQGNMEKEWESEGKGQTQEQVTVRLNTSEKLSDHQTCCMCHMCLPEGNSRSALFYSETPLQQTTENTTGVQSSECEGERGCGRVSSAWQNMCFSLS